MVWGDQWLMSIIVCMFVDVMVVCYCCRCSRSRLEAFFICSERCGLTLTTDTLRKSLLLRWSCILTDAYRNMTRRIRRNACVFVFALGFCSVWVSSFVVWTFTVTFMAKNWKAADFWPRFKTKKNNFFLCFRFVFLLSKLCCSVESVSLF